MERLTKAYDVIILGTGVTESVLGTLIAKDGRKVLMLDGDRFNGGACDSVDSLEKLHLKFRLHIPINHGVWNVDRIPKLFAGQDRMMELLTFLGVQPQTQEIENVYLSDKFKLIKMLTSHLLTDEYKIDPQSNLKEHDNSFLTGNRQSQNISSRNTGSVNDVYGRMMLSSKSQQRLLYETDADGSVKTKDDFEDHFRRFGDVKCSQGTSFLYPLYGLHKIKNDLLKQFHLFGGMSLLSKQIGSVDKVDGVFSISAGDIRATAPFVIGNPSYFSDSVESTGKVIRGLCLLDHSINDTNNGNSALIKIPGSELGKKYDLYIIEVGSEHRVSPCGMFLVHMTTVAETDNPEDELLPARVMAGKICATTTRVDNMYEKKSDVDSKIFITSSYDASLSWDQAFEDAVTIYEKITGKKINL